MGEGPVYKESSQKLWEKHRWNLGFERMWLPMKEIVDCFQNEVLIEGRFQNENRVDSWNVGGGDRFMVLVGCRVEFREIDKQVRLVEDVFEFVASDFDMKNIWSRPWIFYNYHVYK